MLSERAIQEVATRGLPNGLRAVSLRFFNAAGTIATVGVLPKNPHGLISQIKAVTSGDKEVFEIYGDDYNTPDGTCIRDLVNPADIARVVVALLQNIDHWADYTVFNIGTGQGYSIKQILAAAEAVVGKPIPVTIAPRRKDEVEASFADNTLLKTTINFELQNSDLDTILRTSL